MRRYYGFDLSAWLRGDDPTPIGAVLAMLQGLPQGSRFQAHWQATAKARFDSEGAEEPEDDRTEEERSFDHQVNENERWPFDNQLLAMVTNAITSLRLSMGSKGGEDVIGPREWWPDAQKRAFDNKGKKPDKAESVAGFYELMGFAPSDATE